MKDCIFCKITNKEIPCNKIYEDKEFLAFLDIKPLNPGHTLIIPKKHYKWIWDIENFGSYFEFVKKVESSIEKALNPERVVIGVAGEEVPHAHVHLVPRYFNDGMAAFWPTKKYKNSEIKEIAEKLRGVLN